MTSYLWLLSVMVLPTVFAKEKFKCIELMKSSFLSHGCGSNHETLGTLDAKPTHSYNFLCFFPWAFVDARQMFVIPDRIVAVTSGYFVASVLGDDLYQVWNVTYFVTDSTQTITNHQLLKRKTTVFSGLSQVSSFSEDMLLKWTRNKMVHCKMIARFCD